jgi:hypothetical protein
MNLDHTVGIHNNTIVIRTATGWEATVNSSAEEEMDYKLARKPKFHGL